MPYPCSGPSVSRVLRTSRFSVPGRSSFFCPPISLLLIANTRLHRFLLVVNTKRERPATGGLEQGGPRLVFAPQILLIGYSRLHGVSAFRHLENRNMVIG